MSLQADLVPVPVTLLDRFARRGVDVRRLLSHAKLVRSRFEGSKAYVTTRELFAPWKAVAEVSGSPEVGLLPRNDRNPAPRSRHEQPRLDRRSPPLPRCGPGGGP